jgi:hypothetical protein
MDDALFVRGFHGFRDLLRDGKCLRQRERALRDPIEQRRALDEFHDERMCVAGILEAVHMCDVRMVERRQYLRFRGETAPAVQGRPRPRPAAP